MPTNDLDDLRSISELQARRRENERRLTQLDSEYAGRPFPDEVRAEFAGRREENEEIDKRIPELEARHRYIEQQMRGGHIDGGQPQGWGGDDTRWETPDGRPIRVLKPRERMASLGGPDSGRQLSMGKYIRGLVTGHWKGAEGEQRAMSEGTLTAGGYLVPLPLADQVIDKARNQAVCLRAGALTVPMDAATLSIARVTTDPSVTPWHSEAGAITPSDIVFDRVLFTARTLAAVCVFSIELAEDASNIDDVVTSTLAKVLALELDRAALRGSGTPPEPTGIRNQSGVGVDTTTFATNGQVISSTLPTLGPAWDWLSKAVYVVRGLNEYPNAAIFSERTGGELDLLRTTTGGPLPPPISIGGQDAADPLLPGASFSGLGSPGLQLLSTNSVSNAITQGSSNVASSCYVGDFSKLLIGMRRDLVVEISRTAAVGATSMFSTAQVAVRAYLRADVQLARPAAFRVIEGIL